jgi:hypothetical protein
MIFDGVLLSTRTPGGGYGDLIRRTQAISDMYEVPASETVASIYLDDKTCAYYEVDLNEDIPDGWDRQFAEDICQIFRELGGYNGLIVRRRGEELVNDDPWWPDEPPSPANDQ